MIKDKQSRRKTEPRLKFREKVLVSVSGVDEAHEEKSENLSSGGIFILTQTPYSIGTMVEIELELTTEKKEKKIINCLGEVVWTKEFRDQLNRERSGMGVRFKQFKGISQQEFQTLLEQLESD